MSGDIVFCPTQKRWRPTEGSIESVSFKRLIISNYTHDVAFKFIQIAFKKIDLWSNRQIQNRTSKGDKLFSSIILLLDLSFYFSSEITCLS